jgi:hypothetical protein
MLLVWGASFFCCFLMFFVFAGCSMDPGLSLISFPTDKPEDPAAPDSPFKVVSYLGELQDALGDDTMNNIRIADNITLEGISEIPAQKTLEIMEQKTLTINEPININGILNITDDASMEIKSNVTFGSGSRFNVAPRGNVVALGTVAIETNDTVTVQGRISLEKGAVLTVDQNLVVDGHITVRDQARLDIQRYASGAVNGTIIVEEGGVISDATGGDWAWKTGTGSIILKYGSEATVGDSPSKLIVSHFYRKSAAFVLNGFNSQLTLTREGYILDGSAVLDADFKIANTLRIKNGVLKIGVKNTSGGKIPEFSLEESGLLIVENQGILDIENEAKVGYFKGTIEVQDGGKLIDRAPAGGSFFKEDPTENKNTGSIIFYTGSIGQLGDGKNLVSTPSDVTGDTKVCLDSGSLKLKKDEYLIGAQSKVRLVGDFSADKLTLAPTSVLIIDKNVTLTTSNGLASIFGNIEGDAASKIMLVDASSEIVDKSNSSKVVSGPQNLTLKYVSQWQ